MPQSAYAALVSVKSKLTHFFRTIPDSSGLLLPLEHKIHFSYHSWSNLPRQRKSTFIIIIIIVIMQPTKKKQKHNYNQRITHVEQGTFSPLVVYI